MSKFKIVFEVQDEAGNTVVEKSQTVVGLSVEDLARESPAEAARRISQLAHATGVVPDLALMESVQDRNYQGEAILGAAAIIARFIELKLREWARKQ